MAEHLPYYGHEQGCYNSKIPWGPEPCSGCVSLRRAFSQGQRDERERIRTGVTGLPWEVAISFGPIDCDYSCEEGPCGCSGVMRPEGWTTGLEDVLAVIDALKEGEPDVR